MKINLKKVGGLSKEIEISETSTLSSLRPIVSSELGIPSDQIKFLHQGNVLTDETKSLVDLGVKDNDTIGILKQVTIRRQPTPQTSQPMSSPQAPPQPSQPMFNNLPFNLDPNQMSALMNSDAYKGLTNVLASNPALMSKIMQMQQQNLGPTEMANKIMEENPEAFSQMFSSLMGQQNAEDLRSAFNPSNNSNYTNNTNNTDNSNGNGNNSNGNGGSYEGMSTGYLKEMKEKFKEDIEIVRGIMAYGEDRDDEILEALIVSDGNKEAAVNWLLGKK